MMTGDVTCQEARQNGALTHAPDLRSVSSALICLAGWLNQQHAITASWGPCSCCLVRVFRNCTEALDTAGTSQSLAQAKVPRDWRPNPSYGAARKRWLARGEDVCIFTARVNPNHQQGDAVRARRGIEAWCERYLGQILPVTYEKDWDMVWCCCSTTGRVRLNTTLAGSSAVTHARFERVYSSLPLQTGASVPGRMRARDVKVRR